jgi:hypothetical protein
MSALGHNGALTFSSDNGWVAIARSIRSHPLVGIHLFAKPMDAARGAVQPMAAFIDLIMECRYEDGFVQNGGRKMEVKRGQMVGAVSWLAARWNWTPMAVRIWLDKLESDMMISRFVPGASKSNKHVGRIATVISLCNYEQFQSFGENKEQTKQQTNSNQTTNEQQQYKDNKGTREQGNNTPASQEAGEEIIIPRSLESGADLSGEVLDAAWKIAGEISEKVKGPSKNSSPRNRPKGELDGSHGITFAGGKLKVVNGTLSLLRSEFPGIDFDAVCNKAAPALAKLSYPTFEHAMATLRQYAQYAMDDAAKRTGGKGKLRGRVVDQVLKSLSPEKQREYFARMKGGGNA